MKFFGMADWRMLKHDVLYVSLIESEVYCFGRKRLSCEMGVASESIEVERNLRLSKNTHRRDVSVGNCDA